MTKRRSQVKKNLRFQDDEANASKTKESSSAQQSKVSPAKTRRQKLAKTAAKKGIFIN